MYTPVPTNMYNQPNNSSPIKPNIQEDLAKKSTSLVQEKSESKK